MSSIHNKISYTVGKGNHPLHFDSSVYKSCSHIAWVKEYSQNVDVIPHYVIKALLCFSYPDNLHGGANLFCAGTNLRVQEFCCALSNEMF